MGLAVPHRVLSARLLDQTLPLIARTPRELVCLAGGFAYVAAEIASPSDTYFLFNLAVALGGIALFASRFFLARYAGVAAAWGGLAENFIFKAHRTWENPLAADWRAWVAVTAIFALMSRDLVERFDRSPSYVFGLWKNPWADLDERNLRLLRICLYCIVVTMVVLYRAQVNLKIHAAAPSPDWVHPLMVGFIAVGAALAAGWRAPLLVVPLLAVLAVLQLIPGPPAAGASALNPPALLVRCPYALRPTLIAALGAFGTAALLAYRHLRGRL